MESVRNALQRARLEVVESIIGQGGIQIGDFDLGRPSVITERPRTPIMATLGKLRSNARQLIAAQLCQEVDDRAVNFRHIVGLPYGAEDLVADMVTFWMNNAFRRRIPLQLQLESQFDGLRQTHAFLDRRISGLRQGAFCEGDRVLLVGDVLTAGHAYQEAIAVLGAYGLKISDVAVVIDREQGGSRALGNADIRVHKLFRMKALVRLLRLRQQMTPELAQKCLDYLAIDFAKPGERRPAHTSGRPGSGTYGRVERPVGKPQADAA